MENQRRLNELEFALADVSRLPIEQLALSRVVLDRTNTAYHDLLQLATALLRGQYPFIGGQEGVGFSLLFEMNRLFEEFIGRTLRRAMRDWGLHSSSTERWNDVPSGTMDEVSSDVCLNLSLKLATRPRVDPALGHQLFEFFPHIWSRH